MEASSRFPWTWTLRTPNVNRRLEMDGLSVSEGNVEIPSVATLMSLATALMS